MIYIFYMGYNVLELPFKKCTCVSWGFFLLKYSLSKDKQTHQSNTKISVYFVSVVVLDPVDTQPFHFKIAFKGWLCHSDSPQSLSL